MKYAKIKIQKKLIMNFKEFAESRKSVRGFLDKPVPKELIDEIIDAAKWLQHLITHKHGTFMQLLVMC